MSEQNPQDMPIACSLSARELNERQVEVADIRRGIGEIKELQDGYALKFPGDREWAQTLLQLIIQERSCCPFFTFELHFEPQEGPIWLQLHGPEGTKSFIQEMFGTTTSGQ